ncbi:MAG: hypothetical protein HZC36_07170 [Armatimonadetes bacterium]|nr:hypothetical protein [Armatimonadota bacterium]
MPEARTWNANWIGYHKDPREDLGVFAFRRRLDLAKAPQSYLIRVSADQRYKLYVNGELVGFGPQRGDELHWFYETYDLAPFLRKGENWIAALVWNFGRWAPMAQHTVRTAFVLEADASTLSEKGKDPITPEAPLPEPESGKRSTLDISTPDGWEVYRIDGWSFDMMHAGVGEYYIDVGPGEIIQSGYETPKLTNLAPKEPGKGLDWKKPHVIHHAQDRGANGGGTPWMLIPRSLPPMKYEQRVEAPRVRRGFAGDVEGGEFKDGEPLWGPDKMGQDRKLVLTPDRPLLLDYGELLTAYPRLFLSCEGDAEVTLTYDEGLWAPDGSKGNRNEVEGKESRGYQDKFLVKGWSEVFEPLWWRTYRYLKIEVSLGVRELARALDDKGSDGDGESASKLAHSQRAHSQSGVVLYSIDAIETGYPLKAESSFEADDPSVKPIWDVAIRTAERCAGETYFDCPYYEQLQYAGDTRIQALIGYYLGRDRALTRNAVETLGWSLMDNGLTQSRYPSRQCQVIPPFSLWWVMMVWDQLLYDDPSALPDFVSFQTLSRILGRFRKMAKEPGQFWQFGDWVPSWRWGVPPGGAQALMHQITLEMATTAAERIKGFLEVGEAKRRGIKFWQSWPRTSQWWTGDGGYENALANNPKKGVDNAPSEHAEALLRVHHAMYDYDLVGSDPWPTEALAKANAAKCTYYFSYYKHLAMFGRPVEGIAGSGQSDKSDKSDRSDGRKAPYPFDYLQELQPWKEMIENGLSTFAENPEPTRSDCHAWSAHPILGFFQIVAGVTSTAPGWKKARIMPHPGSLRRFDAKIAHPDGELRVKWEDGRFTIDSPIPFEFRWMGKREELEAGKHKL